MTTLKFIEKPIHCSDRMSGCTVDRFKVFEPMRDDRDAKAKLLWELCHLLEELEVEYPLDFASHKIDIIANLKASGHAVEEEQL